MLLQLCKYKKKYKNENPRQFLLLGHIHYFFYICTIIP